MLVAVNDGIKTSVNCEGNDPFLFVLTTLRKCVLQKCSFL